MSVSLVAFGGGTDSTAMLIEMANRGEPRPHAILFADTGGEHPHTYRHIETFSRWLTERQYPEITVLRSPNETLEANCLRRKALPSIAYGRKTCSQRWKGDPQRKWANQDDKCRAEWKAGRKVTKLFGFEYGEEYRVADDPTGKFVNRYPLIEWEMDRDDCKAIILRAGLKLPGKSACFFCPNSRASEIGALRETYPSLFERALAMEANADLTHIKGLGRTYSWRDWSNQLDLPIKMPCECYDGAAA